MCCFKTWRSSRTDYCSSGHAARVTLHHNMCGSHTRPLSSGAKPLVYGARLATAAPGAGSDGAGGGGGGLTASPSGPPAPQPSDDMKLMSASNPAGFAMFWYVYVMARCAASKRQLPLRFASLHRARKADAALMFEGELSWLPQCTLQR